MPHRPSFVDRLTDWIDRLPGPAALYYVGIWLVFYAIETGVHWYDGSYPLGQFFLFHAVYTSVGILVLWLIGYLDGVAGRALDELRPALEVNGEEFESLRYELTTMPNGPAWLAAAVGVVVGSLTILVSVESQPLLKLNTSPPAAVVDFIFYALAWVSYGFLIYHTVRQLRLVNRIGTQLTRINLFKATPLYALSSLTAQTAIAWLVLPYLWNAPVPQTFGSPLTIVLVTVFASLALVTFIWPLLGMHRLLEKEKSRLLGEAGQRLEETIAELHRLIDQKDLADLPALHDAISSLDTEQNVLAKLRTWPWRTETFGTVITAILLPIGLWIIQRLLERIL